MGNLEPIKPSGHSSSSSTFHPCSTSKVILPNHSVSHADISGDYRNFIPRLHHLQHHNSIAGWLQLVGELRKPHLPSCGCVPTHPSTGICISEHPKPPPCRWGQGDSGAEQPEQTHPRPTAPVVTQGCFDSHELLTPLCLCRMNSAHGLMKYELGPQIFNSSIWSGMFGCV